MYGIDSFVDGDTIRIMLQSQIHYDHVYKYTEFILICLFFFIQLCLRFKRYSSFVKKKHNNIYLTHPSDKAIAHTNEQYNDFQDLKLTEILTYSTSFLCLFENIDNLFKCYK